MEQGNKEQLIYNIISLSELMLTTGIQFLDAYRKKSEEGNIHFNDLLAGLKVLNEIYPQIEGKLNHAYYMPMLTNIDDTLLRVEEAVNSGGEERALSLIEYQLIPILQEFKEEVTFWGTIYPDKAKMALYYQNDFVPQHANSYIEKENRPYQVSIFIPVYNKVEYTRQCIESIYRYTDFDRYKCEFILINDGSTDGTEAYFESLNIKKVINLKENVKASIFTTAFRVCEGEFFLFVNNDTLVTDGWLDNLMACIQSDEKIISATPCTPNTSNLQTDLEHLFPQELSELEHFKNTSNPDLWEERSRIMPVIAIYRAKLLNEIGFADRLFYTLEYWDDDFSLRARRAGYRQMLCRDTYCYHFGSVTGKKDIEENNTIQHGNKLFYFKNGVSAWSIGFCFDYYLLEALKIKNEKKSGKIRILGIDCGFGDTLLAIKNYYSKCGNKVIVDSLILDERYQEDMAAISDNCILAQNIEKGLAGFQKNSYDLIYFSKRIENCDAVFSSLQTIYSLLRTGGVFAFSINNIFYAPNLSVCMSGKFPWESNFISFVNPFVMEQELKQVFFHQLCIPIWDTENTDSSENQISMAEKFVFYCEK